VLSAVVLTVGSSCTQKMVCPAYQSAFIFDQKALERKFSYFMEDSTPKIVSVSKTKFLIAEPISYQKKMRSLRTIETIPIYPVIPDSLMFTADAEMMAERDVIPDSLATGADSAAVALHPGLIGTKFNVDQENYMYYFRKILLLPDVRAGMDEGEKASKKKKKGIKGFFKDLFKKKDKKKKKKGDEALDGDSTAPTEEGTEPPKEKKKFFDRFKKKKKDKTADPVVEEEKVDENTEEDDDGF